MDTRTHGPRLMSGIRQYGRYESFKQFDRSSSSCASIGSKSIGKITIDCQLQLKSSQWGVLGEMKFPAGIIYLNLDFGPPKGCRVKSATITITLDEEATCLEPYRVGRVFHGSGCPVQMTEWYGPRSMAGEKKTANIERVIKLTPELELLGNGGGGVGVDFTKTFTHSARWSFNGQLLPGKKTWTYKSLRWDLNENELESQSLHNKVQAAFTFEHSGQPFLLNVDIDGKLEKWNDRMKSKLKFGTTSEKDGKVVTLVDFEDYTRFKKSLDSIAEGLPRAMEMENLQKMPTPEPGTSHAFQSAQASSYNGEIPPQNPAPSVSTPLLGSRAQPGSPLLMPENPLLSQQAPMPGDHELSQRVQEFKRALDELASPDTYKILPEDQPPPSSSPTAVESEGDGPGAKTTEATKPQNSQRNTELTMRKGVDEEAIARLLELPMIIMVLRLLASLMKLLGKGQRPKETPKDTADILPVDT